MNHPSFGLEFFSIRIDLISKVGLRLAYFFRAKSGLALIRIDLISKVGLRLFIITISFFEKLHQNRPNQ